ncbi:MAG: hypothetical protein VYA96_01760 [Verrucomicrobiota bacterium]|nr:hypothetical protein [Verrucomicrobiota bacterium]|tara:strand:+ start:198 stop:596 length:399 start_codon:yes stop_codon:yes gene_type:complete
MSRRAQKGINPMIIALTGIIIALIFVTIIFLLKTQKNSIRSVNKFNVNDYIKEGSTLLGTEGIVTGTVNEKLRWTANRGEVISLRVEEINQLIPILIPPSFRDLNISIGDRFTFRIEVGNSEVLTAKEIIRK